MGEKCPTYCVQRDSAAGLQSGPALKLEGRPFFARRATLLTAFAKAVLLPGFGPFTSAISTIRRSRCPTKAPR